MVAHDFHEILHDLVFTVPIQLAIEIELGVAVTSHDFDVLNGGVHRVSAASKQFALEPESVIDREGFADVFREFALQFLVNAPPRGTRWVRGAWASPPRARGVLHPRA